MFRPKTTLEQWRILQAVVEHGGYAQAAEALNKSQSSLNHAVSKLQDQLEIQLLEVRGRKSYLTEAGEVMLRRSEHLLKNIEELETLSHTLTLGWEPEIRIGVELTYPRAMLYDVLEDFYPQSKGARVNIIDTVLSGSTELIEKGLVDISLTYLPPKGFLAQSLHSCNMMLVCHPNHPLAKEIVLESHHLESAVQIVIRDTATTPNELGGWLRAEQRWTVSNFHEATALVERGVGFCWLPEHLVAESIKQGQLVHLHPDGINFRAANVSLVIPQPEKVGPGTLLLQKLFLKKHGFDA